MKPSLQFTQLSRRAEGQPSARKISALPKTDYNFQPSFADFSGRSNGKGRPSFRGISANYFNSEARSYFAVEASIFGLIVLIAGVPVVRAIATFWHAFA